MWYYNRVSIVLITIPLAGHTKNVIPFAGHKMGAVTLPSLFLYTPILTKLSKNDYKDVFGRFVFYAVTLVMK